MTRIALLLILALAACEKPTPENCRKALSNMQHLLGTENLQNSTSLEGEVRRCRGGSSKAAVDCAIKANTLDELEKCDFTKVPGKKPAAGSGSAAGAAPPAGSAGSAGSAAGSATGSAPGSGG